MTLAKTRFILPVAGLAILSACGDMPVDSRYAESQRVDTTSEAEGTLDQDLDGDGIVDGNDVGAVTDQPSN